MSITGRPQQTHRTVSCIRSSDAVCCRCPTDRRGLSEQREHGGRWVERGVDELTGPRERTESEQVTRENGQLSVLTGSRRFARLASHSEVLQCALQGLSLSDRVCHVCPTLEASQILFLHASLSQCPGCAATIPSPGSADCALIEPA